MLNPLLQRRRSQVALLGAAALLGTTAAVTLHSEPAHAASATGRISAPGSKCVDVAGGSSASGTPVQLWDCVGNAAQSWTSPGDGTLRALGKCLDIIGNGSAAGTKVHLWDCNGVGGQQWQQQANGSLRNPQSGRCLDDPAGATANGTQLQIWDCNGQWPQVFAAPTAATAPAPTSAAISLRSQPGKCIDVAGASSTNGTHINLSDCNGSAAQQWTVGPDRTIRALGKCLDIEGYSTAAGAKVHLWDCAGTANQLWALQSNGALLNPASGRCLDDPAGVLANGTQLQIWDCNNEWPQSWNVGGSTTPPPPPATPFGNTTIHPEKVGIYAVPDMDYGNMDTVQASLQKLHSLLPSAYIRWDNETGHYRETPAQVEDYIRRANNAGVPMIIAACCVDGYDNFWARGGQQPTVSIRQIADGPYLSFADRMRRTYANVKFIETINEPDTSWFVSDPDNGGNWNYYMSKLYAATGNDTAHLMGPATAFRNSTIWNNTLSRSEIQQISYHTYGGWASLTDAAGKAGTWVTEYGDDRVSDTIGHSPGFELADLWNAERAYKLSGNIKQVFYVNLQGMMPSNAQENGHYAFSGQLRGLAAYQALGAISNRVYTDGAHDDFMAADNGSGAFATLLFNGSGSSAISGTRTIPSTSLAGSTPLSVLTITNRGTGSATCQPLGSQSGVSVSVGNGSVSVTMNGLAPLSAVLVSTTPCTALAN